MKWWLAKIVFQIICGEGMHRAQFDEQLRLIAADNETEAINKAIDLGRKESVTFFNEKRKAVQWKFINIAGLYLLTESMDGVELHSRILEYDDAGRQIDIINEKASYLKKMETHQLLELA